MSTREPLALGLKKTLIVEPELDSDGDLEFMVETECDYSSHYVFLPREDIVKLRDHLDALLKDHEAQRVKKPGEEGYVLSMDERFEFERRWDARVKGNLS